MDTTTAFTARLQKLLDYYDFSASGFASAIGVQRSSISHILSGRNKPSLDFVMKILHTFNEVTIEWLIDGKGSFPKTTSSTLTAPKEISETAKTIVPDNTINVAATEKEIITSAENKVIDKILVLYTDGSFDAFKN